MTVRTGFAPALVAVIRPVTKPALAGATPIASVNAFRPWGPTFRVDGVTVAVRPGSIALTLTWAGWAGGFSMTKRYPSVEFPSGGAPAGTRSRPSVNGSIRSGGAAAAFGSSAPAPVHVGGPNGRAVPVRAAARSSGVALGLRARASAAAPAARAAATEVPATRRPSTRAVPGAARSGFGASE